MIRNFLNSNRNKTIMLVQGMNTYTGILRFYNGLWMVEGQGFNASQVSTCGNVNYPYVVVS